jgi:hypothetical protein
MTQMNSSVNGQSKKYLQSKKCVHEKTKGKTNVYMLNVSMDSVDSNDYGMYNDLLTSC